MSQNFDLTPSSTETYEKLEISAYDHKHHMATNCELYLYPDFKVPMHIKSFSDIPDYVEGETKFRVTERYLNRIDLISWESYGTPELFWVILAVNNIVNPFEIEENSFLRILPKSYVEYRLLRYPK